MSKSVHLQILDPRDRKLTIIKAKEREDKEVFGEFPGIDDTRRSGPDVFGAPGPCDPPLCPERFLRGANACVTPQYPLYGWFDNMSSIPPGQPGIFYGAEIARGERTGQIISFSPAGYEDEDPPSVGVIVKWGCIGCDTVRTASGEAEITSEEEDLYFSVGMNVTPGGPNSFCGLEWRRISGSLYVKPHVAGGMPNPPQTNEFVLATSNNPTWTATFTARGYACVEDEVGPPETWGSYSIVGNGAFAETLIYPESDSRGPFNPGATGFRDDDYITMGPTWAEGSPLGNITVDLISQTFTSVNQIEFDPSVFGVLASGAVTGPVPFTLDGTNYRSPASVPVGQIRDVYFDGVLATPELHYTIASGEIVPAQPLYPQTRVTARFQVH